MIYHHGYSVRPIDGDKSLHITRSKSLFTSDDLSLKTIPDETAGVSSVMRDNLTKDLLPIKDVGLSKGEKQLVEMLAQNAHEVWAQNRQREGWRFAPTEASQAGVHWSPLLVPYEHLPPHRRMVIRRDATEFARGVCSQGYQLVPPRRPTLNLSKITGLANLGKPASRRLSVRLHHSKTRRRELQAEQQRTLEAQSMQESKRTIFNTFLLSAARADNTEILPILDQCGAAVNHQDSPFRHTALYLAVKVDM